MLIAMTQLLKRNKSNKGAVLDYYLLKHEKNIDNIFVFLVLIHFRCENNF